MMVGPMEEWCQITIRQGDKQVAIKCMEGKTLLEAMLRQGVRYRCDCGEDNIIRVPVYEEDSMAILSAGHGGTAPPGESRLFYRN